MIIVTTPFLSGTDLDDPSVLSGLPTIYLPSGVQWTFIAGGSLMLMLVVGWPSTLLNSVVGSRYQSLVRWVTTRTRRKPVDAAEPAAAAASPGAPPAIRRSRLPGWATRSTRVTSPETEKRFQPTDTPRRCKAINTSLPSSPEPSSMTLVAEGDRGVPSVVIGCIQEKS